MELAEDHLGFLAPNQIAVAASMDTAERQLLIAVKGAKSRFPFQKFVLFQQFLK